LQYQFVISKNTIATKRVSADLEVEKMFMPLITSVAVAEKAILTFYRFLEIENRKSQIENTKNV
jgi:hypothetical protein